MLPEYESIRTNAILPCVAWLVVSAFRKLPIRISHSTRLLLQGHRRPVRRSRRSRPNRLSQKRPPPRPQRDRRSPLAQRPQRLLQRKQSNLCRPLRRPKCGRSVEKEGSSDGKCRFEEGFVWWIEFKGLSIGVGCDSGARCRGKARTWTILAR